MGATKDNTRTQRDVIPEGADSSKTCPATIATRMNHKGKIQMDRYVDRRKRKLQNGATHGQKAQKRTLFDQGLCNHTTFVDHMRAIAETLRHRAPRRFAYTAQDVEHREDTIRSVIDGFQFTPVLDENCTKHPFANMTWNVSTSVSVAMTIDEKRALDRANLIKENVEMYQRHLETIQNTSAKWQKQHFMRQMDAVIDCYFPHTLSSKVLNECYVLEEAIRAHTVFEQTIMGPAKQEALHIQHTTPCPDDDDIVINDKGGENMNETQQGPHTNNDIDKRALNFVYHRHVSNINKLVENASSMALSLLVPPTFALKDGRYSAANIRPTALGDCYIRTMGWSGPESHEILSTLEMSDTRQITNTTDILRKAEMWCCTHKPQGQSTLSRNPCSHREKNPNSCQICRCHCICKFALVMEVYNQYATHPIDLRRSDDHKSLIAAPFADIPSYRLHGNCIYYTGQDFVYHPRAGRPVRSYCFLSVLLYASTHRE